MTSFRILIHPAGAGIPLRADTENMDIDFKSVSIGDDKLKIEQDGTGALAKLKASARLAVSDATDADDAINKDQLESGIIAYDAYIATLVQGLVGEEADARVSSITSLESSINLEISSLESFIVSDISELRTDISELRIDIDNLQILTGISDGQSDLGVFPGTLIPDGASIKSALQVLESSTESVMSGISSIQSDVAFLNDTLSTLSSDLYEEIAVRISTDSVLQSSIEASITYAETIVQAAVQEEADARVAADEAIISKRWKVERHTITQGDIDNGGFSLLYTPTYPEEVVLDVIGGTPQDYGSDFDVIGINIVWSGKDLEPLVEDGLRLRVQYFTDTL